ncbi:leucine-rich repeat family protein [Dorcoceras hygrometricum]|uniref:Leucine-rich repeat family protein n=1 Tax=Dorcoceras hygrometricum TaxID=472368 RepID=A0A2Z7BDY4_9LAMI|nr:leucine-rich repeat family protein [Dorcoceras hygrometricum]
MVKYLQIRKIWEQFTQTSVIGLKISKQELIRFEYSGYFGNRVRISDLREFRFDSETSVTDPDGSKQLKSRKEQNKISSRADDKSKLEEFLKSDCKREEKNRAPNSSIKQPAQRQDQLSENQNGGKLASWLRSNQLIA